jgi:hypothetical protein
VAQDNRGNPIIVDNGWCGRDLCPFPFPQRLYIVEPWLLGLLDPLIAEAIHAGSSGPLEELQKCLRRVSLSLGAADVMDVMGSWRLFVWGDAGTAVLEDLLVVEDEKILVERVDEALRLGLVDSLVELYSRLTGLSVDEARRTVKKAVEILRDLALVKTWEVRYEGFKRLCPSRDIYTVEELAYKLANGVWGVDRGQKHIILVNQSIAPTERLDPQKLRDVVEALEGLGIRVNKAITHTIHTRLSQGELELAWFIQVGRGERARLLRTAARKINTNEWRCVLRVETSFYPEEEAIVGFFSSSPTPNSILCCLERLKSIVKEAEGDAVLKILYNRKPGPVIASAPLG